MDIYNFAQSTLNKIVVFTQSAAQDDIYKSARSPVILEERSDEESQTEPLPAALEKVYYATLSRRLNRSGEERLHDCRDLTFKS